MSPPVMSLQPWLRWGAFGFAYWWLFLLLLEPGNLVRAHQAGYSLPMGHESMRMTGAALVGALVTPLVLRIDARFPLLGPGRLSHRLLHAASAALLAAGLILISCLLAAWGFAGTWLPSANAVYRQLADNWLILVYALLAKAAIAHWLGNPRTANGIPADAPSITPSQTATHVTVKTRGRQGRIDLDHVDWIETQGNYLALHVGSRIHMLRQSLADFQKQLDAHRFVRVHRRALVAIDRIHDLKPLTNGDAELRLHDNQTVRISRNYRKQFAEAWDAVAKPLAKPSADEKPGG